MTSGQQQRIASLEEVHAKIEALDDDAQLQLRHAATRLIVGTSYRAPFDLVQDAFLSTLEGHRHWDLAYSFFDFMRFAMKSIASNDRVSLRTRSEILATELVNEVDMDADQGLDQIDRRSHVQHRLADEVEVELRSTHRRRAEAIFGLFVDDDRVTRILKALEDGHRGQEIAQQCGLTTNQVDTARRRMNRKLDSVYPTRKSR